MIIKYSIPHKNEIAPRGTVAKVIQDEGKFDFYIQTSPSEENPSWVKLGTFLEEALIRFVDDEKFMSWCLTLFHEHDHNIISKVSDSDLGETFKG